MDFLFHLFYSIHLVLKALKIWGLWGTKVCWAHAGMTKGGLEQVYQDCQ